MDNLKELTEEINIDKEILSTLPQNNKKNMKIYSEKIDEFLEKYKSYDKALLNEIEKRSKKYDNIKMSEDVKKQEEEMKNLESILYLLIENDTSYEKMDLDREISNLTYYYRKDLERVNHSIEFCIRKFEAVGIALSPKDFMLNKYVNEYVSEIFKNVDSNNKNKEKLSAKFEEIYWKCPEIISYIEINIRYLYLKNEKIIDKYYKLQKEKVISKFSRENIRNYYLELKKENIENTKKDKYILINKFLTGEFLVKDYTRNAILDIIKKYSNREDLKDISDEELEKILVNIIKLLNTLKEFKNYNEYKYIIDNVKEIYNQKENYKGSYLKNKKEILNLEEKIIKLGKPKLFKKSDDKNLAQQTKLVMELKEKYKELDLNEVYEKITTVLNEHSTIYDALELASLFYKYLFKCITSVDKEINENDINKIILNIKDFINWPYFTILNNIELNEEKDIMLIIKDRYNLLNINITKDDLSVDNLDTLINTLSKCETYYYLVKNNIDLQELSDTCEFKKILKNV
jgi:hypothetical protein